MNRKKRPIISGMLLFFAVTIHAQKETRDSSGIKELLRQFNASRFIVAKIKSAVDSFYINHRREADESFCIANPDEKFNSTDLRRSKYCNARLVLYGSSADNNTLKVILYEEDWGGGPGKTCDIYEVENFHLSRLVSFFVPPETKTIVDIKSAIKDNKYTIVDSHYRIMCGQINKNKKR